MASRLYRLRRTRSGLAGVWQRTTARLTGVRLVEDEGPPENVDLRLVNRMAVQRVRHFVEQIDSYELEGAQVVRVCSFYAGPEEERLREAICSWLLERLRFGVVEGEDIQRSRYIPITGIDVEFQARGTWVVLYLEERVRSGTQAFVAAYLGDQPGEDRAPAVSSRPHDR